MEKKLRLKMIAAFSAEMEKAFPEFLPVKIKSMYIWPGESVWERTTESSSSFIVLSPDPKGQRDEMTIELGWSRFKRFPELMQRPSITTTESISTANNLNEGSVRIGSLCEDGVDWVHINEETISETASIFILKLRQHGMPFLNHLEV
ncbi:MAG: hypothetical protein V4495_21370 [Pseudomonadota bacterium]